MCLKPAQKVPGRGGGRGGGVYSPKRRLHLSACSPSPFPSLKTPGKRLNGGRCLRRALTGWEGEDRAQGQGSALTHADISQLGRAQLHVLENRGHDGGEKLVGGGILQPKERPLGSRVGTPAPKASPSPKGTEWSQLGRRAATNAEGKRTEEPDPSPPRASISHLALEPRCLTLKPPRPDRPMAVRRPCTTTTSSADARRAPPKHGAACGSGSEAGRPFR